MGQLATIIALIVGGVAGWMAAKVLKRTGFGAIGDIVVGMLGGFVGAWIWSFLHIQTDGVFDLFHTIAAAAVGGIVLLVVWRLARR